MHESFGRIGLEKFVDYLIIVLIKLFLHLFFINFNDSIKLLMLFDFIFEIFLHVSFLKKKWALFIFTLRNHF